MLPDLTPAFLHALTVKVSAWMIPKCARSTSSCGSASSR